MAPSSGPVAQTPESKTSGGLAGVFKSFTGNKLSKSPLAPVVSNTSTPAANIQLAQELNSPDTARGAIYGGPADFEKQYEKLKPGNSLGDRLAAADALRVAVADYPLSGVTSIWYAGKDLIEPDKSVEARRAGFDLLTACVKHGSATDLERKEYFDTLTAPLNSEDFHLQLASIVELAKNGRDLSGFHYDMVPLLSRWLRTAFLAFEKARKPHRQMGGKSAQGKHPLGEETNLHQLFDFIINVIKFSFNVSEEDETGRLIDEVIHIAQNARAASEIHACVKVLDAIVTYGEIPSDKLKDYVKILCSIHFLVREVREDAWRTISSICRSHNGYTTVQILLDILLQRPENLDQAAYLREVRGSLSVLERIVGENGENGFPLVPFSLLMEALSEVQTIDHPKVDFDVLHLILSFFNDDHRQKILEEDWSLMFDIVVKCSLRAIETSDGKSVDGRHPGMSPTPSVHSGNESSTAAGTSMAQMLYRIIINVEQLLTALPSGEFLQKESCIGFFAHVHAHLPESCAKLVIDYYTESRFCYPSDSNWRSNIQILMTAFFLNHSRPTPVRLQALKAITEVYEMVEMMGVQEDTNTGYNFISGILDHIAEERDLAVLQETVDFAVAVADSSDSTEFEYVFEQLHQCVARDALSSPIYSPPSRTASGFLTPDSEGNESQVPVSTPANVITRGLVKIFMRAMNKSASKALRIFDELIWIAKSNSCATDARLSALKVLFRLRADWANRIFLTPFTECEALASSFYRTPASLAKKQAADEAQQSRTSRGDDSRPLRTMSGQSYSNLSSIRSASGVSRTLQRNQHMWLHPDPDALPEPTSEKAGMILVSVDDISAEGTIISSSRTVLPIDSWLDTVITMLQQGCQWEIYSYLLVHLASQLSNQALFKAAVPEIKQLRAVICEQIKNGSFHEPPLSSGLRKADVAICLFHILTMVISYHQHFSRNEEDEIVKTIIYGMGAWERSAKCCIHALSICCHELPASMKLVLASILLKMSQIITQSHVAVHILEFLACLARLPDLYANFRDDEFRTVFGICFRYLQYVRDQNAKSTLNRNSNPPSRHVSGPTEASTGLVDTAATESNLLPNSSDDLPQYVYALAYHVIIFWFLSLRLSDRAGQVSWIVKNLVWTDETGRQRLDQQSEVAIDFIRRVAYADVDESKSDPAFTVENFGEIRKERWLIGQSIVTVEQATKSGWAQITRRQPSSTSHYMIRQKFEPPPPHQVDQRRDTRHADPNVIFPGYVLVQILAPSMLLSELERPVHLPNDDMVKRAISTFDRIPTVDGHKVGVIYIGENQTEETQILANVMGSSDYMEFLSRLGTLTKLQGATFNTQGLDRQYNTDGEFTFCWRDHVTEIVFHVTTMMPTNLEHDPQCIGKKRHIGNDFVNIIFNNSGLPFRFDTFPSDFNYVNIVITPESRASFVATRLRSEISTDTTFYNVQVMSKEGFPEISPAAETKILSLKALPDFVRLLALNASVFSQVWANRHGGEHISSWRNRLREIARLREKYGSRHTDGTSGTAPPATSPSPQNNGSGSQDAKSMRESFQSLRRSSVANFLSNANDHDRLSRTTSEDAEPQSGYVEESMIDALDFSKWA